MISCKTHEIATTKRGREVSVPIEDDRMTILETLEFENLMPAPKGFREAFQKLLEIEESGKDARIHLRDGKVHVYTLKDPE